MPDEQQEHRPDPEVSDRELLMAVRKQDTEAFKKLFHRHSQAVHAYIVAAVTSPDDIDDILQEVWILGWTKLDPRRMRGDSALPWLLATARNLAFNANRARGRHLTEPLGVADIEGADNAADYAARGELATALRGALRKLEPFDRQILSLCLVEGLTYKEAAVRTRTSTSIIRNRLSRSRGFVRGEMATVTGERHAR